MSDEKGRSKREDRTDLAEDRTEYAEDRTMLANERTFSGWMRTGLASVGIGLGFQAIFRQSENIILAKASATLFIIIGLVIFLASYYSAIQVLRRLDAHTAEPIPKSRLRLITALFFAGSMMLGITLWLL